LYTLKTQSLHVTYCRHGSTLAAAAGKMELGRNSIRSKPTPHWSDG
jgi:hypothetical protein